MSLLQANNNSAAAGEQVSGDDYAKGSGYFVWTAIGSAIVLTIAFTLFLLSTRKPPVAAGEIQQMWAHAVHTLSAPVDANGVQAAAGAFDQVLVFSQIRLRNVNDQPIVMTELMTNVTLPDGPRSSTAAGPRDYDRIFIGYPELKGLKSKTLLRETVIQPGEVVDRMIGSSFHVSKEQ